MTGNSSVYVRNENQGEYTKNTQRIHTVKKNTSNNLGLECDSMILGDIYQNIDEYQNIPEYSDNGMIYYLG